MPIVKAVTTIQGQITSCASSIGQAAALAALSVPDDEMQASFNVMRVKRVRGMKGRVCAIVSECSMCSRPSDAPHSLLRYAKPLVHVLRACAGRMRGQRQHAWLSGLSPT
jgi:aspartate/methionine/tyrosine aminotransferase